ncbi:5-phosphohydroxy-L-lysine phospho-lyase [Manis javanica]|nr:5-phosphohydroxy-L-lysine phospho-lyase [Manis javanica]
MATPGVMAAVQAAALEGFSLWRAHGARGRAGREDPLAHALHGHGAHGQLGHRGRHEGLRLARGFTGRNKIIKFNGCYHGHADALLVKAGSGLATFGASSSAGAPGRGRDTVVLEYKTWASSKRPSGPVRGPDRLRDHGAHCRQHEPFVRASVPFTRRIRELTREHGALMVYDEVMTGFRVALGSAQSLYAQHIEGFAPDITVLGKVIGGGMPMAAFGARREIMEKPRPWARSTRPAPCSGNPIATACGLKTLELISEPGFHDALHAKTGRLMAGFGRGRRRRRALQRGPPGGPVGLLPAARAAQHLDRGHEDRWRTLQPLLPRHAGSAATTLRPPCTRGGFVSAAHTDADIDKTIEAAREVFKTPLISADIFPCTPTPPTP